MKTSNLFPFAVHSQTYAGHVMPAIALLVFSICASYANAPWNGFVSDDYYIIGQNTGTLDARSVAAAFVTPDRLVESDVVPYYRPLTRISYLFDKAVFGSTAAGYHVVNIMLHSICSVLLLLTLIRLGCDVLPSFLAALLFSVHPINTEVVNFISARNNILSAIFMLGSFLAFLHADKNNSPAGHLLSGALYFLGLLSKETAVMVLPMMIIMKTVSDKRIRDLRSLHLWETGYILPHVIFFSIYLLLRQFVFDSHALLLHLSGIAERLRLIFSIVPAYGALLFRPEKLSLVHTLPKVEGVLLIPVSIVWLAILSGIVYLVRTGSRLALVGLAWLLINIIPISNIIAIPSAAMAERYLYVPLIGVSMMIASGFSNMMHKQRASTALVIAILMAGSVCGLFTFERNKDWHDDLALARSISRVEPSYSLGRFDLGYELLLSGDTNGAAEQFRTALGLGLRPAKASWANYYLGVIDRETVQGKESERYFRSAINADSGNGAAHYALAMLLGSESHGDEAYHEFERLNVTMRLSAVHLIPDMINVIGKYNKRKYNGVKVLRTTSAAAALPGDWITVHRYPQGTELSFDASSVRHRGGNITATVLQHLSPRDQHAYALRIIRFPLLQAVDALFTLTINCDQKLSKLQSMEFLDVTGATLGKSFPEREEYVMHEYLFPGTPLRSLAETACEVGR